MIDRNWGKPDFPLVSDPFDSPKIPSFISTELENTDTFDVQDIFDLGFVRSDPQRKIYQHKDKPSLFLEEIYGVAYNVKDNVYRRVIIFEATTTPIFSKVLYNSDKPNKEDIKKLL